LLNDSEGLEPIAHESTKLTGLTHSRGAVSLARDTVGTGSAAYFLIVVNDAPSLNCNGKRNADSQGFAAFATVTKGEGMDVDDKIHQIPADNFAGEGYTQGQQLIEPVNIIKAILKK